jgi:hypothetical protein
MNQTALGKAYSDLPKWAKGVLAVGALAATAALIITIKKMIKTAKSEKDLTTWKKELQQLENKYKASYSDAQFQAFANQIYESIKYSVGDDYGLVVTIMKRMNNDLDVALLVEAYGKRQRYAFMIPIGEPMDLFTTMQAELGSEYGGITNYRIGQINTDWAKKGITYIL